jgi:hypothetical protein
MNSRPQGLGIVIQIMPTLNLIWKWWATLSGKKPAVSYRWTGWVWGKTGWSSRLPENYLTFTTGIIRLYHWPSSTKVETPYHDNDLILTPIISPQSVEPEVARNFTWVVFGMEDGNFWHLWDVTRWNCQFLIHTWTFLAIIYVASQLIPLFVLDKFMA